MPIFPNINRAPSNLLGASCSPLQQKVAGLCDVPVEDDEEDVPLPGVYDLDPGSGLDRYVPLFSCMKLLNFLLVFVGVVLMLPDDLPGNVHEPAPAPTALLSRCWR